MFDSTTYVPAETYSMTIAEAKARGARLPETVTAQQHQNLLEAKAFWKTIKPEQVVSKLNLWFCGTQACFGGWLAEMQMFGLSKVRGWGNSYSIEYMGWMHSDDISSDIFGHPNMFWARDLVIESITITGYDNAEWNDHEVVMRRLDVMLQIPVA